MVESADICLRLPSSGHGPKKGPFTSGYVLERLKLGHYDTTLESVFGHDSLQGAVGLDFSETLIKLG